MGIAIRTRYAALVFLGMLGCSQPSAPPSAAPRNSAALSPVPAQPSAAQPSQAPAQSSPASVLGSAASPVAPAPAASASAGSESPTRCSLIQGPEAHRLVSQGALLLDVRTQAEYASSHLDGSLNIPLAELSSHLTELDRGRPIVVHCRSGARSAKATAALCDAGFRVYNLGPMSAWSE